MTTTAEVIFTGLLILSLPEGDNHAVVTFPGEDHHEFKIALLKGHTSCGDITASAPAMLDFSPIVTSGVVGEVLQLIFPDGAGDLNWLTGPTTTVPYSENQSKYLSWMPSLSSMVVGESRLRAPCRDRTTACSAAAARFFVDRGTLSVCHLVHDIDDGRLILYELPDDVHRAVGDAISVKEEFAGDSIELAVDGRRCTIEADAEGNIQLFVSHNAMNGSSSSHFRSLHRLHRNMFQRMDRSRPEPTGRKDRSDYIGTCEEAVRRAQELVAAHTRDKVHVAVIHSPTECGGATQP